MYMDKEMKALEEQAFCVLLEKAEREVREERERKEKERKEKENGSDTTAKDNDNR